MRGAIRILAAVAFGLSSLAFAGAFYWASDWNWAPLQVPLPGPGLVVEETFKITTSGKFELEASVPVTRSTSAVNDPQVVPCRIEASVTHNGAVSTKIVVSEFRASGRGSMDTFTGEPARIDLTPGSYVLKVRNAGSSQPFGDRGALLRLTRFVHPTEFYLQGVILRALGWCGLVLGVTITVVSEIRNHIAAA
jgi:hypothetical protein